MREGHAPEVMPRPWHGASDRADDPAVLAIRLHRAEVEALIHYRRLPRGGEERARAWQRAATLRARRVVLMPAAAARRLPPLPMPPAGMLSAWQKLRRRLGLARH